MVDGKLIHQKIFFFLVKDRCSENNNIQISHRDEDVGLVDGYVALLSPCGGSEWYSAVIAAAVM